MNKKTSLGLGKGLGALISDASNYNPTVKAEPASFNLEVNHTDIKAIPLSLIETNPFQPRQTFDETTLEELADSIRILGLIQPITVRQIGKKYQIISGERRFRASKLADLDSIPAYIRNADDQGMLEMAIVENIQRENLDAIEVALSFQRLIEECSLTQEKMAERVGKKRATITNYLRLLKLPAEIQLSIRAGKLSMGHAKALLSLENRNQQLDLCNSIIEKELSVREVEAKVKALNNPKKEGTQEKGNSLELPDQYFKIVETFGKYFNNNVSVVRNEKGKGNITIHFANDAEIDNFLKILEKSNL